MRSTVQIINFTLAYIPVKAKLGFAGVPQKLPMRFAVKPDFDAALFPLLKTSHKTPQI
ncbi:hypothetical protein [Pedobacter sp. P26]|uniref:hypothetical protein n=1 Tax=Pedobacter sp. P26 TaxID=3423956 RepID=UPI003D67A129